MYLAAGLYCDGRSSPVKIRNMSESGALIDSAGAPPVGSLVQLVRGTLIAHGLVAWSSGSRCGMRFSGRVDVAQWRAAPANAEQQRVDDVVRLVKAGAIPLPLPARADAEASLEIADGGEQLAGDVRRISRLLDGLSEELAGDPLIVERHGPSLQHLDIAAQVLAAIEAILIGERNAGSTNLQDLRRSADQALIRDEQSRFNSTS
jgi:hypothetical protein